MQSTRFKVYPSFGCSHVKPVLTRRARAFATCIFLWLHKKVIIYDDLTARARANIIAAHFIHIAATALNFYLIWRVMTYVVGRHFTIGAQFQRLYKLPHLIARRLADPTGVGEVFLFMDLWCVTKTCIRRCLAGVLYIYLYRVCVFWNAVWLFICYMMYDLWKDPRASWGAAADRCETEYIYIYI